MTQTTGTAEASTSPAHAGGVLVGLILVATVANLNLAVANVALPDIGVHFQTSQTQLDVLSVAFSLGLAGTVLYLGAIGDRFGRKGMLLLGTTLAIPTSIAAAWAPNITFLIGARVLGGVAAGMAFPTTLALITALWSGPARVKSIAAWSAVGGSMAALGPLLSGLVLSRFWWGSCFLITVPLAFVALFLAARFVPAHINETTDSVDHLGGIFSVIGIIALVMAINFVSSPGDMKKAELYAIIAVVGLVAFFIRQRFAKNPLFDLNVASRRIFWVAACAGMVVFGALMGAIFIGMQYLQNVLGYSTVKAGASVLPAAVFMMIAAPISARLIERFGSRITLLIGYTFCFLSFLSMLLLFTETSGYIDIGIAFSLAGAGVGIAGTPASHSLTGSVPVDRAVMASGTADLQRDLGGAIMQSILGALLTAGYAASVAKQIAPHSSDVSTSIQNELEKSYSSAAAVAQQNPAHAQAIIAGAKSSFLAGANWAYAAGCIAIAVGALIVGIWFPRRQAEIDLVASYEAEDAHAA